MLTYQVRPRVFRITDGEKFEFPSDGQIRFSFLPLQPFGMEAGGGHTAVRAVKGSAYFNANTGEHTIESKPPLNALDVTIKEPDREVRLDGNVLTISQHFKTNQELTELIESIYFGVPSLLSVNFADPPYIKVIDGTLGKVKFRWELAEWSMHFRTTTQEHQELKFVETWERIGILAQPGTRRLLGALHYFYVALRLSREGSIAGGVSSRSNSKLCKSSRGSISTGR